jgi:hypothetical protein
MTRRYVTGKGKRREGEGKNSLAAREFKAGWLIM